MELTTTIVNAVVVTAVGAVLAWLTKSRFEALERRMDRHEAQNEARFEQMQTSLDGLRSDMTHLALALGARPRAQNG